MDDRDDTRLVSPVDGVEPRPIREWIEHRADIERIIATALGVPHHEVLVNQVWTTHAGMGVRVDVFSTAVTK